MQRLLSSTVLLTKYMLCLTLPAQLRNLFRSENFKGWINFCNKIPTYYNRWDFVFCGLLAADIFISGLTQSYSSSFSFRRLFSNPSITLAEYPPSSCNLSPLVPIILTFRKIGNELWTVQTHGTIYLVPMKMRKYF